MRGVTALLRRMVPILLLSGMACGVAAAQDQPAFSRMSQLARGLFAETSSFQRSLLADGQVSFSEYQRSVRRTVSCLKERGHVIEGPWPSDRGKLLRYQFSVPNMTDEISASIDKDQQECAAEFLDETEWVYVQQIIPRGTTREVMKREFAECVRSATDEAVAPSTSPEDLITVIRASGGKAAFDCLNDYDLLFVQPVPTDPTSSQS